MSTSTSNIQTFLFASESVSRGHPDKLCDQISDAVLDACLAVDSKSRVALETAAKANVIGLYGEITCDHLIDYVRIARDVIREVGYNDASSALDWESCSVHVNIHQQSGEIAGLVDPTKEGIISDPTETADKQGAGDQGLMMGYATNETPELMPLTLALSHAIHRHLRELFETAEKERQKLPREERPNYRGPFWYLRPDAKSQVVVEYAREGVSIKPKSIHTMLISTQHAPGISHDILQAELTKAVIQPVLHEYKSVLDSYGCDYDLHKIDVKINPKQRISGCQWTIGGPLADAGVTGRKIIVDSYGGWGGHGGGAFSGKDPSKVDRSGAYVARWVAKSIVAAGLAERVMVQLAYIIGIPEPTSVYIDTYGTGKIPDDELKAIVELQTADGRPRFFDFRPGHIIRQLNLLRPIYRKTAFHGHFGRFDPDFTWETPNGDFLAYCKSQYPSH